LRIRETFLASAVRCESSKRRSPGLSVDFHVPIGDDGGVARLPDCFGTLPLSSVLACPGSSALAKQDDEAHATS
jgi:hypothetical protein